MSNLHINILDKKIKLEYDELKILTNKDPYMFINIMD